VKDTIVLAVLLLAFATLITVHIALASRLVLRARPRWRGVLALVVPPLAPIWAFREGWRRSAVLWIAAVVVYLVARIAAER
jgi:hypothetical protein